MLGIFADGHEYKKAYEESGSLENQENNRLKYVNGHISGIFHKTVDVAGDLVLAVNSDSSLGQTLDKSCFVIHSIQIVNDAHYIAGGELENDVHKRDILNIIKHVLELGINFLVTTLFLESVELVSLGAISSLIGSIPLVGSAIVNFGLNNIICVGLIAGGVIGIVQDIKKLYAKELTPQDFGLKLVAHVINIAVRVYCIVIGQHLVIILLATAAKLISGYFDYKDLVKEREEMSQVTSAKNKIFINATPSLRHRISAAVARIFNSSTLMNKLAKLIGVVAPLIPGLGPLGHSFKKLKETIDCVSVLASIAHLKKTMMAKTLQVAEVAKAVIFCAVGVLGSINFLANYNLLGLGMVSGKIGFNVLGIAGRLSLGALAGSLAVVGSLIDVGLNIQKLWKEEDKITILLLLINTSLKVGVIVLSGGALIFAGFAGSPLLIALGIASALLDFAISVRKEAVVGHPVRLIGNN